jgi:hypothetical protein
MLVHKKPTHDQMFDYAEADQTGYHGFQSFPLCNASEASDICRRVSTNGNQVFGKAFGLRGKSCLGCGFPGRERPISGRVARFDARVGRKSPHDRVNASLERGKPVAVPWMFASIETKSG